MATPSTLRRPSPRPSSRLLLPFVALVVVVLALLGSAVGLLVDLLWFRSVGFASVFTGVLSTRVLLFVLFGTLVATFVGANLVVAHRLRPPFTPMSAEQQNLERYRTVLEPRLLGALLLATAAIGLFVGLAASAGWEIWLAWRNGTEFGQDDAQFGRDISYFAFTYPFQRYVLGFAFGAVVLAGLRVRGGALPVRRAAAAEPRGQAHARRPRAPGRPGGPVRPAKGLRLLPGPLRPGLQPARDGHRPVLHRRHGGAAGQDVPRRRRDRVRPAVLRRGLPRGLARAGPGARRPHAVRRGRGRRRAGAGPADQGQPERDRPRGPLHRPQHRGDPRGVRHRRRRCREQPRGRDGQEVGTAIEQAGGGREAVPARLLDPALLSPTFQQLQQLRTYYGFSDQLDVDRYDFGDGMQDYVVAARGLDLGGLPAGSGWIQEHLIYTHGNGFVAAPAAQVNALGQPVFEVGDLPQRAPDGVEVEQSRIYYGENAPDYSIAPSRRPEIDGPRDTESLTQSTSTEQEDAASGGTVVEDDAAAAGVAADAGVDAEESADESDQRTTRYEGDGGVGVGSLWRKLLFAVNYQEANFLLSDDIEEDSKVLFVRDPADRVAEVAPWLTLDGDTYPVLAQMGEGRDPPHRVGGGRLHDDGRLPLLRARRARRRGDRRAHRAAGPAGRAGQLHPQLGEGRRRRLRRQHHALRVRRVRPGAAHLAEGLPRHGRAPQRHPRGPGGALPLPRRTSSRPSGTCSRATTCRTPRRSSARRTSGPSRRTRRATCRSRSRRSTCTCSRRAATPRRSR